MYTFLKSSARLTLAALMATSLFFGVMLSAPVYKAEAQIQTQSHEEMLEMINQLMAMIALLQAQLESQATNKVTPNTTITVGDTVRATDNLTIRNNPGGARIGVAALGEEGQVVAGPSSLDGRTWWKVDYKVGPTGWSAANWLTKVSKDIVSPVNPSLGIDVSNVEPKSGYTFDSTDRFFVNFDIDGIGSEGNDKDYMVCLRLTDGKPAGAQVNIPLGENGHWCTPAFDATYTSAYDSHVADLPEGRYQVQVIVLGPENPLGKDRATIFQHRGSFFLVTSEDAELDGALRVQSSSNDPDSTTFQLDSDSNTNYEVFVFELEGDDADFTVDEIKIEVEGEGSADDLREVLDDVKILIDGQEPDNYEATINSNYVRFEFGDVVEVDEDIEVEVSINFEFEAMSYIEPNTTIQLSVDDSDVKLGDISLSTPDVDVVGSATGEEHTLILAGPIVDLVSTDEEIELVNSATGAQRGHFEIVFDVTAVGDDLTFELENGEANEIDFVYWSDADGSAEVTSLLTSTADDVSRDSGYEYLVEEGETEEFTLHVTIEPEQTGMHYVRLAKVGSWESSTSEFKTDKLLIEGSSDVSPEPDLATYKGYMDGHNFITTNNISYEDALENCKLNAENNPTKEVYCTWNGDEIYRSTPEVDEEPPYTNNFSCGRTERQLLGDGSWACFGMWDYGNSFGGDEFMCGSYNGETGCQIETQVCSSGLAEATEYYSNRNLESLSSSKISDIATMLKTTDQIVREEVAGLWVYKCIPGSTSTGPELHVIGVYEAAGASHNFCKSEWGEVEVALDNSLEDGVSLVLSSYEPVVWNIKNPSGIIIDEIYLTGYNPQEIRGNKGGASVKYKTYYRKNSFELNDSDNASGVFYDGTATWPSTIYHWSSQCAESAAINPEARHYFKSNSGYVTGYKSSNNSNLLNKAKEWTGREVSSFQGAYSGSKFVVGSGQVLGASTSKENEEIASMLYQISEILKTLK